jgi:hypothetical protein
MAPVMQPTRPGTEDQPDYSIVVRFGSAVLEAGHTSVPNLVLGHYAELGVSAGELVFMLLCLQHKWSKGNPHPSLGTIATKMGVSRRQVRTYASGLRTKHLLSVEERSDPVRGQLSSVYDFTPFLDAVVRLATSHELPPGKDSSEGAPRKKTSYPPRNDPSGHKEDKEQEDEQSSNSAKSYPERIGSEEMLQPKPVTRHAYREAGRSAVPRRGGTSSLAEMMAARLATKRAPAVDTVEVPPGATQLHNEPGYLASIVEQVSQEIGDTADIGSNVARSRRLMARYDLEEAGFAVVILRAQALLRERSRNGRRPVRRPGAYLFRIIEDLLLESRARKANLEPSMGGVPPDVPLRAKRAS